MCNFETDVWQLAPLAIGTLVKGYPEKQVRTHDAAVKHRKSR